MNVFNQTSVFSSGQLLRNLTEMSDCYKGGPRDQPNEKDGLWDETYVYGVLSQLGLKATIQIWEQEAQTGSDKVKFHHTEPSRSPNKVT